MPRSSSVLIAGAGIGGLSTAIALRQKGFATRLVERRAVLREEGAGLQLGPNAVAALKRLGVAEQLKSVVHTPNSVVIRDGATGTLLKVLPLGQWIADRHGAPYWTVHRVDLHNALRTHAETLGIAVETSTDIRAVTENDSGITTTTSDGRTIEADALIGADGLWSRVRSALFDISGPVSTGWFAARATLPRTDAPRSIDAAEVGVWMLPNAHIVNYPVRHAEEINIVVVLRGMLGDADHWSSPLERGDLLAISASFAPPLRALLEKVPEWLRWPLLGRAPLSTYARNRVALIGDAAHPTFPFFAQGAAMAIEDAEAVAAALVAERASIPNALLAYDRQRRDHTQRLVRAATSNGHIYHADGPLRLARNAALAVIPGPILMSRYDWIYRDKQPVLNS